MDFYAVHYLYTGVPPKTKRSYYVTLNLIFFLTTGLLLYGYFQLVIFNQKVGVHFTVKFLNGKEYQKTYHLRAPRICFTVVFLFLNSEQ